MLFVSFYELSIATNCVQNVTILVKCSERTFSTSVPSFPREISCIFCAALQNQSGYQPDTPLFHKIQKCLFHKAKALSLGGNLGKNLRVFRLGNSKVEISVELLCRRIIVGMIYPCIRCIGNAVSRLYHCSRINHILVENGLPYKSPKLFVNAPVIGRTYIGAKIRFNAVFLYILKSFYRRLFRIVKRTGIFFNKAAVLCWKLSCIGRAGGTVSLSAFCLPEQRPES